MNSIKIYVYYIDNTMEPIKTFINKGKYKFQITDNTLEARGQIYSRNFKVGGNYADCVNVSISYKNNNPDAASIPHIIYDPDCSIDNPLDHGQGSIIMIKTLLEYVHKQLPSISEINFEDKSNIECSTEDDLRKGSRTRKRGTHLYPISLYYFSIAFNGKTWYEKHFNARQKDNCKHNAYREKIGRLLDSKEFKSSISFIEFLQIATPAQSLVDELESYYNVSDTFGEFFQSIPKRERCRLVGGWISTFMEYHLKDVFDNKNWIIEVPLSMKGGNRNTRKYYCPKGRIKHYKSYKNFGVRVDDV